MSEAYNGVLGMDCTMYQVLCSTISAFLIIMMDVSFIVIPGIVDRVSLKSLFRLRTLCRVSSWLQDTWEVAILWGCSTATVTPVWLFPPPSREKSSKGQWIWGDQPATMENIHPPPRPPPPGCSPPTHFLFSLCRMMYYESGSVSSHARSLWRLEILYVA